MIFELSSDEGDSSKITTEDVGGMPGRIARCEIAPRDKPHTEFESGAQIINHLLRHPEIQANMDRPVSAKNETQSFYLRIHRPGYQRWKAADLEGGRYPGPAADNAPAQDRADEPGASGSAMRSAATTPVRLATPSVGAGGKSGG